MTETSFSSILEQIVQLHQLHPDYTFEYIQEHIVVLDDEDSGQAWIVKLYNQWQEMSEARQQACSQIFQAALHRAQQATYRPVNDLDSFLERQLYGIQDDQVVHKGLISAVLKQRDQQRDQQKDLQHKDQQQEALRNRQARPHRPGRTNPLNSVVLPPRSPEV